MKLGNTNMNKLLSQMFAPIDNVVWDMMAGTTGVKREDGIYTLGASDEVDLNPFDAFAMEMPAFSQLTPVDQVKRGDVMVSNGKATGWILEAKTTAGKDDKPASTSIQALSFSGHQTRFRPKNVKMMGMNGIAVVRSPFNFETKEGEKSDSPFGGMDPMMLMLMMGDKGGTGSGIDAKTMMLMSMMSGAGGSGGMGSMNPMMLMMLMGDGAGFQTK